MPHELAFMDALVPTLFITFLMAMACSLIVDQVLARRGIYQLIWYPALFRFAIFVLLNGIFGLCIY